MKNLNYYVLDENLGFGQYRDFTLRDVISAHPSYIQWCLVNVHHFTIARQTMDEIAMAFPNFKLSDEAEKARTEKVNEIWIMEHNARIDEMRSYDAYEGDGWAWIADNG